MSEAYDVILSIIEDRLNSMIRVYPNPTNGLVNIKNMTREIIRIEIWSPLGKKMVEHSISGDSEVINLSGYQKGLYQMKIFSTDKILFRKIIVN